MKLLGLVLVVTTGNLFFQIGGG